MIGEKIKLAGKSRKGKQRIKEHGEEWLIEQEKDAVLCLGAPGYFIRSVKTNEPRWIKKENDEDFTILKD